jgi:hypothetical protein
MQKFFKSLHMENKSLENLVRLWDSFFYAHEPKYAKFHIFWVFLFYLIGICFWGKAFDWGQQALDYFDWALINTPRIDFVRDAIRTGVLPLHMSDIAPLHHITDRFFALPDVVTTPQMVLLLFVSIQKYVLFDIFFHYTLGFLGLLWFYRKYHLSPFTFVVLFFLFSFNGYIFSHYTVGHFTWAGYFLFPAFFALIVRFLNGEENWRWVTALSFLLFYMILAGSQHHYVWLLIFLGFLDIVCWRRLKWILAVVFFSGFLSAIRLLPPALQLADYQRKGIFSAIFGYPSLGHMFESMILIKLPSISPVDYFTLDVYHENYWDFNFFIGIIGFLFVVTWGIYYWLRENPPRWQPMIVPTFALVALSVETTYWVIRATSIPLFDSERATMRILGVPMVWLFILSAILFQEWWNRRDFAIHHRVIALGTLIFMAIDIVSNMNAWSPSIIRDYFIPVEMNITGNAVANHSDPVYVLTLGIGFLLTLGTATFLVYQSFKEHKARNS